MLLSFLTMKMKGARSRYGTPEFEDIATKGTILRCEVGSGIHGIAIEGTDDRDEMGICIEPPAYVLGLQEFEQYLYRSAWERGEGEEAEHLQSQPGDLDLIIYSLRKWMQLALNGNPSILLPLFAPESRCSVLAPLGRYLRQHADRIICRQAGLRFLRYLENQRDGMLGLRSTNVNRPELVERYGYDTKYAAHAARLGYQGIQLMEQGILELPMPETQRMLVLSIKRGLFQKERALDIIYQVSQKLTLAMECSELREEPDRDWADRFLIAAYENTWRAGPDVAVNWYE